MVWQGAQRCPLKYWEELQVWLATASTNSSRMTVLMIINIVGSTKSVLVKYQWLPMAAHSENLRTRSSVKSRPDRLTGLGASCHSLLRYS